MQFALCPHTIYEALVSFDLICLSRVEAAGGPAGAGSMMGDAYWPCGAACAQVLVGGAGAEAPTPAGGGLAGPGDLAGVPGRGRPQLHQPGLPQLRAHQPEPQGPRPLQLRGRTGAQRLTASRRGGMGKTYRRTHAHTHTHTRAPDS